MNSLEDILNASSKKNDAPAEGVAITIASDAPAAEGEAGSTPTPDNGETVADAAGETAADETAGEQVADAETAIKDTDSKEVKGLKKALLAERGKRQAAEKHIAILSKNGSKPMEEDEYMGKIDDTESLMREIYPDYDEALNHFYELIDNDQTGELQKQLNEAKNPVIFAYQKGKETWDGKVKTQEEQKQRELDALKEKIRQEVEAEYASKNKPKPAKTLPDGGGAAIPVQDNAQKSLTDILGR